MLDVSALEIPIDSFEELRIPEPQIVKVQAILVTRAGQSLSFVYVFYVFLCVLFVACVLLFCFSPTAASFGVSAQIGSGVARGGPEVRSRVPPGFYEGCTRVPRGSGLRGGASTKKSKCCWGYRLSFFLGGRGLLCIYLFCFLFFLVCVCVATAAFGLHLNLRFLEGHFSGKRQLQVSFVRHTHLGREESKCQLTWAGIES